MRIGHAHANRTRTLPRGSAFAGPQLGLGEEKIQFGIIRRILHGMSKKTDGQLPAAFLERQHTQVVIGPNVHWIEAEKQMRGLGVSSKLNARMDFLLHLKQIGRDVAEHWLETHFDAIGHRSTIDIKEKFL